MYKTETVPAGRPTDYRKRYCKDAKKLCTLGATDKDLADFFDVSRETIDTWKNKHSEFLDAIKGAKEDLDKQVERSLCHRAMGYEHPDVDIKVIEGKVVHVPLIKKYPPSEVACIFWLKNRQPAKWRDKQELGVTVEVDEIALAAARLLAVGKREGQDSTPPTKDAL